MGGAKRMITVKRGMRRVSRCLGPGWVVALMALWGFAMILPAALPH